MKINIITICLDGMPFIQRHLDEFKKLKHDWHWWVVEGVAGANRDTAWCAKLRPRLSQDGTTEYLMGALKGNPKMTIVQNPYWNSKVTMFNNITARLRDDCVVMQIDADEIWTADQIDKIVSAFEQDATLGVMQFKCNYFVGKDIVAVGENCYGNKATEWVRAWRFRMGMTFDSHEPPVLSGNRGKLMGRNETEKLGLVFNHYAYATEAQVAFKEVYYKYAGAVAAWKRLQANTKWPVRLGDFLPWVTDDAQATRLQR